MVIDPKRTRVILFGFPDNSFTIEITRWLQMKLPAADRTTLNTSPLVCARNIAITKLVLPVLDRFDDFIFFDKDMRPDDRTDYFLEIEADIVGCQFETKSETAWLRPDSIHEALWRAKGHVFKTLTPPWFMFEYNESGTQLTNCTCGYFSKKARDAGFTIARGGWCKHDPSSPSTWACM